MPAIYSVNFTDAERQDLARTLGMLVTKLTNAPLVVEAEPPRSAPLPAAPAQPAAAQPVKPPVVELRDRWQRNKAGVEQPNPDGCEAHDVRIWKTEKKKGQGTQGAAYLRVTWCAPSGQGYVDANCFDQILSAIIMGQSAESSSMRLYTVRKGNYLNVVGVRA